LDVRHQAQHLKQLAIGRVQIREHQRSTRLIYRLDYSEQNRDADAVDQLGFFEVDHDVSDSAVQQLLALGLDAFASELIQVDSRVNHRRVFNEPRFDLSSIHGKSPLAGRQTTKSSALKADAGHCHS